MLRKQVPPQSMLFKKLQITGVLALGSKREMFSIIDWHNGQDVAMILSAPLSLACLGEQLSSPSLRVCHHG